MEILSQSTDWWIYIPLMLLCSFFAVALVSTTIYGIYSTFREGIGDGNLIATIVLAIASALMVTGTVFGILDGPTTTYKAIITDYNVVYEEGYEIISTDGKIVTLTKE